MKNFKGKFDVTKIIKAFQLGLKSYLNFQIAIYLQEREPPNVWNSNGLKRLDVARLGMEAAVLLNFSTKLHILLMHQIFTDPRSKRWIYFDMGFVERYHP